MFHKLHKVCTTTDHYFELILILKHFATPQVLQLQNYLTDSRNSVACSPQPNYTDWATATGWRILVPTFADRGVSRGQRGGNPTAINLSFLDRSCSFFLSSSSSFILTRLPDTLLLRKSGSAENRTRDLWVCSQKLWPVDHRGGRTI
jgi:hypothetical protein